MEKIETKQLTDNKWLNLFNKSYPNGLNYFFCSRRKGDNVGKEGVIDAVRALPYFIKDGRIKIVLIRNFRYPLDRELYELPAGLIDEGEDAAEAMVREVEEEIGAEVVEIEESFGGYNTPGMADEFTKTFITKVKLTKEQSLDEGEYISLKIIDINDIPKLLDDDNFCLQSKLLLLAFYYKNKRK